MARDASRVRCRQAARGSCGRALAALLVVFLLAGCVAPPAAPQTVPPSPSAAAPTPRPDGLSAAEAATLASLTRIDDFPLYTLHLYGASQASAATDAPAWAGSPAPGWGCSLLAALGDPERRVYGRNFDWRYSPALLLFAEPPATGGYASVAMVDLAYLGFGDRVADLTALPLADRRALLRAPSWPFDGMNAAGVSVGMAAVPQADARRDPGKPSIGSLRVMREILDRAGSTAEAVAILRGYNIDWEGGPPLHYLVADRSGQAALVEFEGGVIVVRPQEASWHAATNFTRSAVTGDAAGRCWRYDTLVRELTRSDGKPGSDGARRLLQAVSVPDTQWSVVYDMSAGRIDVVVGRDFQNPHTWYLHMTPPFR